MRYLVILIWPVGMAAIVAVGAAWARRASGESLLARASASLPTVGRQADGGGALGDAARLVAIAFAGALAACAVMLAVGAVWVVHHGASIDAPIYRFIVHHQVHRWVHEMNRLTKIGNTWTTWGAAGAAGAVLAVLWTRQRWVPPTILAAAVIIDHFETIGIRHVFGRVGPPNSPLGTYPSGGCERVILFYGLIAYLVWREASGRRSTGIWAGTAVALLAFNEAYSRTYLTLHWFTDAISGLLYGVLMLAAFAVAVRMVVGPTSRPRAPLPSEPRHSEPLEPSPAMTA